MPWPIGLVVKNGSKARAITSGVMPVPVSVTQSDRYCPAAGRAPCAARVVEPFVRGLDRDAAAIRHRVARVDAQIEQCVFELRSHRISVDHRPDRRHDFERDLRPDACAGSAPPCPIDQPVHVGRLRIQRLPPREGEQAMGQRGGAFRRALRDGDVAVESRWYVPDAACISSSSSEPMMPVRRLLKSCAMPPVSWPTASIFCDWRSASSACLRSAIASAMRRFERFVQVAAWPVSARLARRDVLEQHRDLAPAGRLDPERGQFEIASGGNQFALEADRYAASAARRRRVRPSRRPRRAPSRAASGLPRWGCRHACS